MKIIGVTLPYFIQNEAELIMCALDNGIDRMHIRKPDSTLYDFETLINNIKPEYRERITIHDHFNLAPKHSLGGIHVNSRNKEIPSNFNGIVSKSCHSLSELEECKGFDYVTLSPIFNSISKDNYKSNFSEEVLIEAKKNNIITSKIIALGGITEKNICKLQHYGFGGAAILGYLWESSLADEMKDRVEKIKRKCLMMDKWSLQYITHKNDRFGYLEGALKAMEGGCRWIQLRMKDTEEKEFIAIANELRKACTFYNSIFIIDDHVELVDKCGADGVHLGKKDMKPSDARKLLGNKKIIGGTANTIEDIENLILQEVDYIGAGPFRFTSTKKNLSTILGIDGYCKITQFKKKINDYTPLVAIGGINSEDIEDIINCEINGIAVSGTILNAENPSLKTKELIETLKTYVK